jgi:ribonuclease D
MEEAVVEELQRLGARAWQIEITAPMITQAILEPKALTVD